MCKAKHSETPTLNEALPSSPTTTDFPEHRFPIFLPVITSQYVPGAKQVSSIRFKSSCSLLNTIIPFRPRQNEI